MARLAPFRVPPSLMLWRTGQGSETDMAVAVCPASLARPRAGAVIVGSHRPGMKPERGSGEAFSLSGAGEVIALALYGRFGPKMGLFWKKGFFGSGAPEIWVHGSSPNMLCTNMLE